MGGQPYVGLLSDEGGELWGYLRNEYPLWLMRADRHCRQSENARQPKSAAALKNLDDVMGDVSRYQGLRFAMGALSAARTPEVSDALAKRLKGPFPEGCGANVRPTANPGGQDGAMVFAMGDCP